MDEEWRTVARNPAYEVSNLGRIRKILPLLRDHNGYLAVQFYDPAAKSRHRNVRVHQLVAEAFLPNPDHLPEVNHKNSNKLDSSAENLEWVTRMENQRHMIRSGLRRTARGETSGTSKLNNAQVIEIRSLAGQINQREIAERFGVTQYT